STSTPSSRSSISPKSPTCTGASRPRSYTWRPSSRSVALLGIARADENRHVPHRVPVLTHQLMREADLIERERPGQAGIDLAGGHHRVVRRALVVVGEMRALEPLLAHPQVAEIHGRVISGRARADHHHATVVAHED